MRFDPQKPIAQKFYTSWRDMVYAQEQAFGDGVTDDEAAAAREKLGGVKGQGITSETGSAFRDWEHHVTGIIDDLRFQNDFLRHSLDLLTDDEQTPQPNGWETELAATDAAIAQFKTAAEPTTDQQTTEPPPWLVRRD